MIGWIKMKLGMARPHCVRWGPHLTQCGRAMPSFILIHPTVWPQYTNVRDRQDRQTGQTDRQTDRQTDNGPVGSIGRSPKNPLNPVFKLSPPRVRICLHAVEQSNSPTPVSVAPVE